MESCILNIADALLALSGMNLIEVLEMMLVVPLEHKRLKSLHNLKTTEYESKIKFLVYHLKSNQQAYKNCLDLQT